MLIEEYLFIISVGLLVIGGLLSLFFFQKPRLSIALGFSAVSLAALSGLALGLNILLTGTVLNLELPWMLLGNRLGFAIDQLAAFFIVVISLVSFAVSIFSVGYVTEYAAKNNVGFLGFLFNFFILSMIALVSSDNSLMFLFFWELMSLVSFFLVVFEHQHAAVRKSGYIYAVMTHTGTLFITAAFLLLFMETGSFSFEAYAQVGRDLPVHLKTVIFLLAVVGFGTKAGIIPLHIWLPRAHPAAPSNVSAVMSAVMIKTAIYGLVKIVIDILGGGPSWWGGLVLVIGAVSALLGVMYALMERDLKRLLAYSSVENIGIVLMGLGAAIAFQSAGQNLLAAAALTAGLLHLFNHAVFKSLLFLGVGSIQFAARTKDLEKMGGLLKRMPWTGLFFLIGALSISAIPLFNGFISEWLVFQSLLHLSFGTPGSVFRVLGPLSGAALALTGALAATCFVKAFGIPFLALPRSQGAEQAVETPVSMRLGMGILALLCVIFGLMPAAVLKLLGPVSGTLLNTGTLPVINSYGWIQAASPLKEDTGISPLLLAAVLALVISVVYLAGRIFGYQGAVRKGETWNCGTTLTPEMEYTSLSFSKPIQIIFRKIYQPRRQVKKEYKDHPYFVTSIKYSGAIRPLFEELLYGPAARSLIRLASGIRVLQSGSIHLYLTYIFVTLVILLLFIR